jgi:hypothetical protein
LLEGISLTDFMKSGQQDANFGNRVLKCSQLEFEAIGEGKNSQYRMRSLNMEEIQS